MYASFYERGNLTLRCHFEFFALQSVKSIEKVRKKFIQ